MDADIDEREPTTNVDAQKDNDDSSDDEAAVCSILIFILNK